LEELPVTPTETFRLCATRREEELRPTDTVAAEVVGVTGILAVEYRFCASPL
jgi:hypothetical protein